MREDANLLEVELYNYKANQTQEGVPSNTNQVLVEDWDNNDELLNDGGDHQTQHVIVDFILHVV